MGVAIDVCSKCNGVWLDPTKLNLIIEKAKKKGFKKGYNQADNNFCQKVPNIVLGWMYSGGCVPPVFF